MITGTYPFQGFEAEGIANEIEKQLINFDGKC